MYLAITIDVEEDNWADYEAEPALGNIHKLLELQSIFDRFEVKPTYLISYPVAADKNAVSLLRKIMEDDRCEIGAHLHPWNTPPLLEEKSVQNTMLLNLDKELQFRKMESLHAKIVESFGMEPVTFRSGRWGFDHTVAENIFRLGYKVDSSVSPYINWNRCHGPDFSKWSPDPQKMGFNGNGGYLLEVPATIGFLQPNFDLCNKSLNVISGSFLKRLRLRGILDKLHIVNKVWLSPESDNADNMIKLAEVIRAKRGQILNMFFHSPSLQHGLTHFTKTKDEEKELFERITIFLEYAKRSNIRSVKLSQCMELLPRP